MMEYSFNNELDFSKIKATDIIKFNCENCGKECKSQKRKFSEPFCFSCKIKKKAESGIYKEAAKKAKITYEQKHGKRSSQENLEKMKKRNLEKYGVEFYFQSKDFQNKRVSTIEKNYSSISDFYKVQNKKSEETFKNNHTESKGDFLRRAFQKKYSVDNPRDLDFVNQKIKNTCKEKYGVASPLENKEIHKKGKDTFQLRYGSRSTFSFGETKKKAKEAMLIKFGVEFPGLSPEIMGRTRGRYSYNNKAFDSSWELAYYIWLQDKKISFEYHPNIKFPFEFEEKTHYCLPDFSVNGKLKEIKGSQFIDGDEWICPFDRSLDGVYEAKHQCLLKNNVEIVTDCSEYVNYVKEVYGNNFLQNCKKARITELAEEFSKRPFPYYEVTESMSYSDAVRAFHKSIYSAHKKGKLSPVEVWKNTELMEEVVANRLTYNKIINEETLRRGIDVLRKNPKVSVFSPHLGIKLMSKYFKNISEVFDPFSGFSGRMIAACDLGKHYIGQDINKTHIEESSTLAEYYGWKVELSVKNIFESTGEYEALFTCPPYKDKEIWNEKETVLSCDDWISECLKRFKCKKYLFVIDETEKYKDFIVEELVNKSHFGTSKELVILIESSEKLTN